MLDDSVSKLLLLLFLGCCTCYYCRAQDPFYINYDTKDGLPSSEVYDVEVDQNGMVWFTTDRGVCTYDGYRFETFSTNDGLSDNTNFEIYRDSQNRLWFNGYNGTLSIYENEQFSPYQFNDSLVSIIDGLWVANIIEADSGYMYCTADFSLGFSLFKLTYENFPTKVNKLPNQQNIYYGGGEKGVLTGINNIGFSFGIVNPEKQIPVITNRIDSFWIHTKESIIYKTDLAGKILQQYNCKSTIGSFYMDQNKNIWCCTDAGLVFFKDGYLNADPVRYFDGIHITNIAEDLEGNYWASTLYKGILFIPSFDIKTININEERIINENIRAIGKLKDHIVFSNADLKFITVNSSDVVEHISFKKQKQSIINYFTEIDEKLFAHWFVLEEKNGKLLMYDNPTQSPFLMQLKNGIHIGFANAGFYLKDIDLKPNVRSNDFKNPYRIKITEIIQSANEDIWLGTVKGLYCILNYDFENPEKVLSTKKIDFGRINDIKEDAYSNLWVATIGNGLFYKTPKKDFHINGQNVLNSGLINCIYMNNDSTLWVGTSKGLSVLTYYFNNDSLIISNNKSLTTADGLPSNFISAVEFWNNKMWLGTSKGICSFDPDIVYKNFSAVPVIINEFIANDSSYNLTSNLVLDHYENDIFINFTGISYRKEDRPFYRYRLIKDEAKPLLYYTNQKDIRYNDLDPGKYTFEVFAQNKAREWNESPASISFEIKPHFSQTNWFKTLMAVLILSIGGLLIYAQISRVRAREAVKRQLQFAQLRMREAELNALRNQMNPHFVFNSLNSIQNFIFKKDIRKANHFLSKFSGLMRNSLQYTRLELITLKEELDFLKDYLELESMRFPDKFASKIIVSDEIDIYDLMVPPLLLQPILENIVKHAFKDLKTKGLIEIEIVQNKPDYIDIYIRDNGPGLPNNDQIKVSKESKHRSLGIEIVKNRIKLLNESNVQSKSSVSFINRAEKSKELTGLEVYFTLPIVYQT